MRDEKCEIETPGGHVIDATIANRFATRLFGLMTQNRSSKPRAMLFPRCRSVHMGFMRVPIDIVYLHGEDVPIVLGTETARPWHATHAPRGTGAVLELPAGWAKACGIERGCTLGISTGEGQSRKASR